MIWGWCLVATKLLVNRVSLSMFPPSVSRFAYIMVALHAYWALVLAFHLQQPLLTDYRDGDLPPAPGFLGVHPWAPVGWCASRSVLPVRGHRSLAGDSVLHESKEAASAQKEKTRWTLWMVYFIQKVELQLCLCFLVSIYVEYNVMFFLTVLCLNSCISTSLRSPTCPPKELIPTVSGA